MEVHKIVLYVVDFDRLGADGAAEELMNASYPNRCLTPEVLSVQTVDIGPWEDGNPLNRTDTCADEIKRLFGEQP